MSSEEYLKLDARITALFLIQAQAFGVAATAQCGKGNEHTIIEKMRKLALETAKDWPSDIRAGGTEAVEAFYAFLDSASKTGMWG